MDKSKRKNLIQLLGKDPEKMDRKQWDSALENLFQKIKKTNRDPFEAKEILNKKLLEAFSKDYTSFDKHKDVKKQLSDILSMYGLTPEQAKKVELNVLKGEGIETSGGIKGGATEIKETPKFRSIEEIPEFYKKGEFTPVITAYAREKKPEELPYITIPHEALHATAYFQRPEAMPYIEKGEKINLSEVHPELEASFPIRKGETVRQSIKRDPSLKNILLQSKSTEHFPPITPLYPPGYGLHERIFEKTHPFVSKPEVIPPEQPLASGIFAKETTPETPSALSQEELYNALYNMGDKETYDPLRRRFNKIEDLFREVKAIPQKKAQPIKPAEQSQEPVNLQQLIRDIQKSTSNKEE